MIEEKVLIKVKNDEIPVAVFVQTASKYQSSIKVRVDNKEANAKSIMGMFSIGLCDGQEVTLVANGEDAEAAIEDLKSVLTK